MAIVKMIREFQFGGTSLPDPDPEFTKEQVLEHYSNQYPQLKRGKIEVISEVGDTFIYEMKKAEFAPDG
jgi:PRTRC genetic system protein C